jgi:hypothetical protein
MYKLYIALNNDVLVPVAAVAGLTRNRGAGMRVMLSVGLLAWLFPHRRWPDIGRFIEHPVG